MTQARLLPNGLDVTRCPACGGPVFWATTPDGRKRFMLDGAAKCAVIAIDEADNVLGINPTTGEPVASPSVGGFALHGMVCRRVDAQRSRRVELVPPPAETGGVGGGLDSGSVLDVLQNNSGMALPSVSVQKGREAVPPDVRETAIEQRAAADFANGLRKVANGRG